MQPYIAHPIANFPASRGGMPAVLRARKTLDAERVMRILKLLSRMCPTHELRRFARTAFFTRNIRTAYRLHTSRNRPAQIRLPGFEGTFKLRTGTTDADHLLLLANGYDFPEYRIPISCRPHTILDLGANIGVASIILAQTYPEARIFAFEPLPDNYKLLEHNVAAFGNITPVPFGLGARTEYRDFFRSSYLRNQTGGFYTDGTLSFSRRGPRAGVQKLPVLAVPEALRRYGIRNIDIIKIDTEGAEYDILTNIPHEVLDGVTVVVGEFHGIHNRELRDFLERRFQVDWTVTHTFPDDLCDSIGVFQAVRRPVKQASSSGAGRGDFVNTTSACRLSKTL